MIFGLSSVNKEFQVTFTNNCLCFGNVNIETECFSIHHSEFESFFKILFYVVKNYQNHNKTKIFFIKTY